MGLLQRAGFLVHIQRRKIWSGRLIESPSRETGTMNPDLRSITYSPVVQSKRERIKGA
jgi:hypothetical protein